MKKISGFKLGLGVIAAAFFAFIPNNTFATVKIGTSTITANSPKSNISFDGVSTITIENSNNASKTLTINEAGPVTIILKGTNKLGKIESKNKITFAASTGSLSLTSGINFTGNGTIELDPSICADSKLSDSKQSFVNNKVTISSANCGKGGGDAENPDTFDMIYVYAAVLLASSAILGYRRYLAKH